MANSVRQGQLPPQFNELFVNAATGNDEAEGSSAYPYKTLTRALQHLPPGMTTIRLSPGTYSVESGERFPIFVPNHVSVAGEATGQGATVVIRGGGEYNSPTFGRQSITLRMGDTTLLNGVTITNPTARGTGIWIESVATIANCRILNCGREGIFATDSASLAVVDCLLQDNRASGISLVRNAKGQIRRSTHKGNSFGLVISDYAAPLVIDSQFLENRAGIVLSGTARPVFRNNRIEHNQRDGLSVFNQALPDLGRPQDPAHNLFQDNGVCDLRNATSIALTSVGNELAPWRVEGEVEFSLSRINSQQGAKTPQRNRKAHPTKLKPVLTPVVYPPSPPPLSPIPDLTGHWAEPFVHGLLSHWSLNSFLGNSFQPDRLISRAEYTTWVIKTFNLPTQQSPQTWQDVPSDYWANTAIVQAQRMGFIDGFPDQTFRPEAPLTRLQAIVSLVKGLGLADGHPDALQCYADRVQVPSWAVGAVASTTQNRLIVSHTHPDHLRPLEHITRAEVAAMLYQGLVWLGQARAIASPHIVKPIATASFSDLQDHWASEWIRGLASQGGMGGSPEGWFEPDRILTRIEYAALLCDLFHPTPKRSTKEFTDISGADVSDADRAAIDSVYRGKLMGGFADDTFRPQQPITRVQVLLALVSALQCSGADLTLIDRFEDSATIPQSSRNAIAAATAQWLVVNYPNLTRLQPNRAATRAEVAAMVYQALVRLGRAPAIASPYIIDPRYPNQHLVFRAAPIVVLDPGHGGADLGTVAETGGSTTEVPGLLPVPPKIRLQEKDIVLSIAQETATLLRQQGVRVLLTRSVDRHVDSATRVAIAEQVAADVLLSLHANATQPADPEVNGLESYYAPTSAVSKTLAHTIHTAVLQALHTPDRGIRPANFYGLRSASMPAAHIEIGYLTGKNDGPNLADPEYGKQMAAAIANGILQYEKVRG